MAPPPGLVDAAKGSRARADVVVRPVRMDRWDEEIAKACDVMNASLAEVEGHVPVSQAEFAALARQFKTILDPRILLFAECQGQVVGFALLLPEVNEVLAHLGGRLFPFGWLKAWWYGRRIRTVSFKIAGVLPAHRKGGLAARLAIEASLAAQAIGYRRMEMSVVNESNRRMRDFIELQGAKPYLRYRLYRRAV